MLNLKLQTLLENAEYTQETTLIPNDHPVMAEFLGDIQAVAEAIGVPFEETGYTFKVTQGRSGPMVYSPYVANNKEGIPCLCWGRGLYPLEYLKVKPEESEGDRKQVVIEFDLSDLTGITYQYPQFSLALKKPEEGQEKAGLSEVKRALKKGYPELAKLLSETFTPAASLSTLEPGDYKVTGYEDNSFKGESKAKFKIEIEGHGWFKANTAINRKLARNPVITPDEPADLEVKESTETSAQGYPIIPVVFTTRAESKLPVFTF
jgi:hypothetical protein